MSQKDKRELLLDTAEELFGKQGYDSTGVQEIVQKAELSKPTLYYYFGNKEGLLQAVLERRLTPFCRKLEVLCQYHRDLVKNLEDCASLFWGLPEKQEAFCRLWLSLYFLPRDHEICALVERFRQQVERPVRQMFREAAEQHGNMKGRETLHAGSFLGILYSYMVRFLGGEGDMDARQKFLILKHYMHGIFS